MPKHPTAPLIAILAEARPLERRRRAAPMSWMLVAGLLAAAVLIPGATSIGSAELGPALPGDTAPNPNAPAAPRIVPGPGLVDLPPESAEDALWPQARFVEPDTTRLPGFTSRRDFLIGYLPDSSGDGMNDTIARRLAKALEDDDDLRRQLRSEGYSGHVLALPADGYIDLLNRLEHQGFDLAFCPASVFATLENDYRVVLQQIHPGGATDTRGGGQHFREAALIAGPTSPLFRMESITTATLQMLLRESDLAVPSAYDAAGFFYPRLALARAGVFPARFRFCGSSREVVKHVVSGLADVGACDMAALNVWLAAKAPEIPLERMARIIPLEIQHVPTDPVIVRERLNPQYSEAGRQLKDAVKRFFSAREATAFRLEDSRGEQVYERLRADLARLRQLLETSNP